VHADGPVAFERAGATGFANHPVEGIARLEAYIGVPIHRGAQFYGTLSFCSQAPRSGGFTTAELDALMLMGSWLSNELVRRHAEMELDLVRGQLEGLERNDPLTDMLNRRGVKETFERHAERCGFDGSALACVLIDIDDFSAVNHRFGHAAGDRVICEVARRLRASLRPSDVAGRIGGDEFLAVLPNATLSDAKLVAERIAANVRDEPVQVDGQLVAVTVSIGAARLPPGVTTITDALTLAHDLLRESKRGGKDAVTVSMRVG
jgi:diguanylate cyclase (GGDEF)-like protein